MGQSMEEGRVVRWLKQAGARVERGEPLVEIETDKANVEVEASAAGILSAILAAEDTVVAVGIAIGVIEDAQAVPAGPVNKPAGPPSPAPVSPPPVMPPIQSPVQPLAQPPAPAPGGLAVENDKRTKPARLPASPLARRLASELGVDLHQVTPTGPGGRIGKADVLAWAAKRSDRRIPLSKIRRTIGLRMAQSKATIPHFYLSVDLDMRAALALRSSLVARGRPVSLTAILLKATALALALHPVLNATLDGDAILPQANIDLAIAVALDDGLITPIVGGCQALSLEALARAAEAVIQRAREGRLQPQDLAPGTFTVSNLGMFGVKQFEAIINPPQAAILALGTLQRVPVFDARDNLVAADLLTATLSVDHRVADGAEAARFLATLKDLVADGFALL
jgi:pyruvate dehydrogenase E2 component (dihydrolipoamide acetyltransferase)